MASVIPARLQTRIDSACGSVQWSYDIMLITERSITERGRGFLNMYIYISCKADDIARCLTSKCVLIEEIIFVSGLFCFTFI